MAEKLILIFITLGIAAIAIDSVIRFHYANKIFIKQFTDLLKKLEEIKNKL